VVASVAYVSWLKRDVREQLVEEQPRPLVQRQVADASSLMKVASWNSVVAVAEAPILTVLLLTLGALWDGR
jgi:hypothetical protein